jgi:hypothetical protein
MPTRTTKYKSIDLVALRNLYQRAENEKRNRVDIKISIMPESLEILKLYVPFGRGLYGSPFIELSLRSFAVLLSEGQDLQVIANEINSSVHSPYLRNNLYALAKLLRSNALEKDESI